MIDQKFVRECFDYNQSTGVFIWLERPRHHFPSLAKFGWWLTADLVGKVAGSACSSGHLRVSIDRKSYLLHRLAWVYEYGDTPNIIDHINGVPTDNRILNLRNVDHSTNMRNQSRAKNNTSGHLGVSWNENARKWKATVYNNGENIHLGYFNCKDEANRARIEASSNIGYHANHGRG